MRLIAPGFYGVANVKWLTRIEVLDHRFAGRFMARDYVQVREEERDGQACLDVHHGGPRPASSPRPPGSPGTATATSSWASPGALRSPEWR